MISIIKLNRQNMSLIPLGQGINRYLSSDGLAMVLPAENSEQVLASAVKTWHGLTAQWRISPAEK